MKILTHWVHLQMNSNLNQGQLNLTDQGSGSQTRLEQTQVKLLELIIFPSIFIPNQFPLINRQERNKNNHRMIN